MSDEPMIPGGACLFCHHLLFWEELLSQSEDERGKCKAFPDGIPDDIWFRGLEHDKVMPGQVGDFVHASTVPVPNSDDPEYGAPPMLDPDSTFD